MNHHPKLQGNEGPYIDDPPYLGDPADAPDNLLRHVSAGRLHPMKIITVTTAELEVLGIEFFAAYVLQAGLPLHVLGDLPDGEWAQFAGVYDTAEAVKKIANGTCTASGGKFGAPTVIPVAEFAKEWAARRKAPNRSGPPLRGLGFYTCAPLPVSVTYASVLSSEEPQIEDDPMSVSLFEPGTATDWDMHYGSAQILHLLEGDQYMFFPTIVTGPFDHQRVRQIEYLELRAGNTLILPNGYTHADYSVKHSVRVACDFFTPFNWSRAERVIAFEAEMARRQGVDPFNTEFEGIIKRAVEDANSLATGDGGYLPSLVAIYRAMPASYTSLAHICRIMEKALEHKGGAAIPFRRLHEQLDELSGSSIVQPTVERHGDIILPLIARLLVSPVRVKDAKNSGNVPGQDWTPSAAEAFLRQTFEAHEGTLVDRLSRAMGRARLDDEAAM